MKNIIILLILVLEATEVCPQSFTRDVYGRVHEGPRFKPRFKRGLEFEGEFCENLDKCNITKQVKELLRGYDKRIRPLACDTDTSLQVEIDIVVLGIGNVDEVNMEFRADIIFTQRWKDPRLVNDYRVEIDIPRALMKDIWIPDSFFVNAKNANGHQVWHNWCANISFPHCGN